MGFLFGSSSAATPPPPSLPDPLPSAPSYASGTNKPAGGNNKIPGFGSTLMTSTLGSDGTSTNVQHKSLLGQ